MTKLKKNIVANFGGSLWTGLMSLVFVPLYIRFMGIEAYGLVGVFTTLLSFFSLLDMGLSNTLNREMARLASQKIKKQEMRDLVRTLEIPYWAIGLLISIIVIVFSRFIAYRWVNAENISPKSIQTAVILMGFSVAFQWPISFYAGGLMGLQRQVLLNGINAVMATFRGLGAVMILWLVSPTVEAFFIWQLAVSVVNIGLIVFFLWRNLPITAKQPRFRPELLLNIWHFAAGVTGITVLVTILTQLDKIILSRMLSLKMFGYYTLAYVVAMTLYRFVGPVFSATYPQLTNLVALDAKDEITKLYHKSAQLISVLVLPAAFVVALFSKEILLVWTQNPVTAEQTHYLVSILVVGTALNSLMNIPYALQLASGWTKLTFNINLFSVLLLTPLIILLTKWFGAVGAASIWVILNAGYALFYIPIMHRRLLRTEKWRWYFEDVGLPLFAAAVISVIGRCIINPDWPPLLLILSIVLVSGVTFLASACVANKLDVITRLKSLLVRHQIHQP
jgi:O-antigen/teichoic acid export membrane protein